MQISFKPSYLISKPSYTDNGTRYKKTNLAKTAFVGLNLLNCAAYAIKKGADVSNSQKLFDTFYSTAYALGMGCFIDGITNKINASKADKINIATIDAHQG